MERRKFIKSSLEMALLLSLMPMGIIQSCTEANLKNNKNMNDKNLDVVIIGGGPTGMNAALLFGRTMMKTVIINEEKPRNRVTQGSHGFVTRDGIHPLEFLDIAKNQLVQYDTVSYIKGTVTDVEKQPDGFLVKTQNGEIFTTNRVMFATGYKDDLSKIGLNGVEKVYGKTVYPCPFCDGWERRNEPLALFGEEAGVTHFAKVINNWTTDLIIFTNGKKTIEADEKNILKKNGIEVIEDKITELISENGNLTGVHLENGNTISRTGGFLYNTGEKQSTDIPSKLGVKKTDWGPYETNDWGKTNIEGIYIIGDAKNGFTGVIGAASEGANVAEMITKEIIDENWIS